MAQRVPYCVSCKKGVIKPDIVFFGESLPSSFEELFQSDVKDVALLIVIGSSLKVAPVADIVSRVPFHVPQILINREPNTKYLFDVQLLGNCDEICQELAGRAYTDVPETRREFVQVYLEEEDESPGSRGCLFQLI
ncbi:MAG: hypothetical protein SGCHY_004226 [Lobulomycetales sp.]